MTVVPGLQLLAIPDATPSSVEQLEEHLDTFADDCDDDFWLDTSSSERLSSK